jgi:crotonobetainyl-CoA:carnitine CoA-transferase CaiB-like acyl-CoA transferase
MRVLELAQIMAGPTCGMMLADMGADVIKVEKLPGGDDSRSYQEPRINGVSAPFLILNRNKRGMALNLKHPQGREILLRMVRDADVLTENYRLGTLDKLGLSYDVLAQANPGLIYCAVSGYGRDGPLASKGGFDLIAQGFSGLMSVTGEPGRPPVKTGNSVADINAGIPRGRGDHRCLCVQVADWQGADRRHIAVRSGTAADVLASRRSISQPANRPDRPDRRMS